MQIREFAERVLTATTLDEKLAGPDSPLIDDKVGAAIITPNAPGRPESLVMHRDGVRIDRPNPRDLESDHDRGILLHFLANHELLATELMALVLLKFPDAPAAFRRGVARTLQEEQEHTRLYMQRMADCGVEFGEIPVNGFFWKAVSTMETPLDYVTRLSLTFEQANLDFSHYYGGLFRSQGDLATAEILETIYRDEIAHVGYGLKWFRRWSGHSNQDAAQNEFETFESSLHFPLSPIRAKGDHLHFNTEGRRAAGLSEEFVRRLRLYRRSRGRTPNVHLYNPEAESVAAHHLSRVPEPFALDPTTAAMRRDLETLPLALAVRDDVILVESHPSDALLEHWLDAGIEAPEFVVGDPAQLNERKLDSLVPWAWDAGAIKIRDGLDDHWAPNARHPSEWCDALAQIHGKAFSIEVREAIGGGPEAHVCRLVSEMQAAIAVVPDAVLKPGFGIAGRRMLRARHGVFQSSGVTDETLDRLLREHGHVVIEPWLDRVLDFSIQYELAGDGTLKEIGWTRLLNDDFGRFLGSRVGPRWSEGAPSEVLRWFHESGAIAQLRDRLPEVLSQQFHKTGLIGAIGVDAFVYRDRKTGRLELNPVCEVNPRVTMGRIALGLRSQISPGAFATLRILTKRAIKAEGFRSFVDFAKAQPKPELNERGQMAAGTVLLNDPQSAEVTLGVFEVG